MSARRAHLTLTHRDITMNQSRNLLLLIAAACVTALSVALYAQHYKDMLPCPLCVIQR
jgi:protein dithiol:quinone oxidoreductase